MRAHGLAWPRRVVLPGCLALLGALLLVLLASARPALAATITVTTAADDLSPNNGSVSLREAITAINAGNDLGDPDVSTQSPGPFGTSDTINFNIVGAGVHALNIGADPSAPGAALPTITKPVVIDGYTQPGSRPNAQAIGTDAVLLIELNGTSAAAGSSGLQTTAPNTTVRGLVINRFSAHGIFVFTGGNGVTIQGNYIGTNASGLATLPNGSGIEVNTVPNATIGGLTPASRNVISGNAGMGVQILSFQASGATIQGNYVGLDATGSVLLGNGSSGIDVAGPPGATIGPGNVVSGNEFGIDIVHYSAINATIRGNYIGLDATGTVALGNSAAGISINGPPATLGGTSPADRNIIAGSTGAGIVIEDAVPGTMILGNVIGLNVNGDPAANGIGIGVIDSQGVTIGGVGAGAGNLIASNTGKGVSVSGASSTGSTIRGNTISANGELGIDLGFDGLTPNDTGDGDTGPNALQNFPVLTSSATGGGTTRVVGSLNSTANTTFLVDVYANPSCDASGYGEAQTYLGATRVYTDGSGNAGVVLTNLAAVPIGYAIAATATDPGGSTSELSRCQVVTSTGAVAVAPAAVTVSEGGTGDGFTVALSRVPSSAVTVNLTPSLGQITVSPVTLTFLPNASALTPQTVTVSAVDNGVVEGARSASIALALVPTDAAYIDIPIGSVAATIAADEIPPAFSIGDVSLAEPPSPTGMTTGVLTVMLSPPSTRTVTVQYAFTSGTATGGAACGSGVDGVVSGAGIPLTFAPGESSKTISLGICGDDLIEPDETLTVGLVNPTGGALLGAHPSATVTIRNVGGLLPSGTVDSYTVAAGTTLSVVAPGVLANDANIGSAQTAQAQLVGQGRHGNVSLIADGGFSYTPNADFAGTDTFSYRVTDGTNVSAPVTVTITVTPASCGPRPRVTSTAVAGGGQLQMTLQVTPLGTGEANAMSELDFGTFQNAQVTLNGQPISSGQVVTLPTGTTTATFTVRRVTAGQAATVPFTVKDRCGAWSTFVGGGTAAGF